MKRYDPFYSGLKEYFDRNNVSIEKQAHLMGFFSFMEKHAEEGWWDWTKQLPGKAWGGLKGFGQETGGMVRDIWRYATDRDDFTREKVWDAIKKYGKENWKYLLPIGLSLAAMPFMFGGRNRRRGHAPHVTYNIYGDRQKKPYEWRPY